MRLADLGFAGLVESRSSPMLSRCTLVAGTVSYLHMHRACESDGNVSESLAYVRHHS